MNLRGIERFDRETTLPLSIQEAWAFFSNPRNLATLTPSSLNFQILAEDMLPQEIYAGLIICYTIHPLPYLTKLWVTEITQMDKHNYFIDEQRFGPYAFWHHQHHFQENNNGVVMKDIVHYKIPFGAMFLRNYIRKQLRSIFDYRADKMKQLFK